MQIHRHNLENGSYVRILALNGGGARCWSALLIIEDIMARVVRPENTIPKPCEYFHLIVGSEWGGILAIMLGRLQLTIGECRKRLCELRFPYGFRGLRIFPGLPWLRSRYYKAKFQEWCRSKCDGEAQFYDKDLLPHLALTMVIATDPTNLVEPKVFKSYLEADSPIPIWKVAMAVIATPIDLDPVKFSIPNHESYMCIASSLAGLSNPSWIGLTEARKRFHPQSINMLLNIGCGGIHESTWPERMSCCLPVVRGMALTKMVIGQVIDGERTVAHLSSHQRMLQESINSNFYYQYLSASEVKTSYYDWSGRSRNQITTKTKHYCQQRHIDTELFTVAKKMVKLEKLIHAQRNEAQQDFAGSSPRPWLQELKRTQDIVNCHHADEKVKLAILDTGIDICHPWIKDEWIFSTKEPPFYDFTGANPKKRSTPVDDSGHGTQMAGIILQIVPYVELIVIRVFEDKKFDGCKGKVAMDRVRQAILFAVNELEVNIISMSFAFEGLNLNHDLDGAIRTAIDKNVVLFAAASNSGHRNEDPYPASDRRVFRVNAVDEHGDSLKCNPPAGLDDNNDNLAILGVVVPCPKPRKPNQTSSQEHTKEEELWTCSSGTSSATALMSAVCALTMSFGRVLPGLIGLEDPDKDVIETWNFVNKPQGMRQLLWRMSGGRNRRTRDQFSYVCPWYLLSSDNMVDDNDFTEIARLYFESLRLAKDGMN